MYRLDSMKTLQSNVSIMPISSHIAQSTFSTNTCLLYPLSDRIYRVFTSVSREAMRLPPLAGIKLPIFSRKHGGNILHMTKCGARAYGGFCCLNCLHR